jgi:hypothetical protein
MKLAIAFLSIGRRVLATILERANAVLVNWSAAA